MRFRSLLLSVTLAASSASPALAQEAKGGLLTPNGGVMFWTLVIFIVLLVILSRFAYPPLLASVEAREKALQDALDKAQRDREEAARVLADHRQQLDAARGEAQRMIAEGRATAEKLRVDLLEQTKSQQQDMLERARRDIATERDNAIHALRREAVDLAIAGATKVIERNLDNDANRQLVEGFLSSLSVDGKR